MFYFPGPGPGVIAALDMVQGIANAGLPPAHVGSNIEPGRVEGPLRGASALHRPPRYPDSGQLTWLLRYLMSSQSGLGPRPPRRPDPNACGRSGRLPAVQLTETCPSHPRVDAVLYLA